MAFDIITFGLLLAGFIVLVAFSSEILARITRIPNIVFLLLTAFITWELLYITLFTPLFLAGLVVVGLLIIVVRPLAVMASTIRAKFTLRERIFMSFFGPRGIVIAATGAFFSITLALDYGIVYNQLTGYIFLIVLLTVVIQAGLAPYLAKTCDICTVEYGESHATENESSLNQSSEGS